MAIKINSIILKIDEDKNILKSKVAKKLKINQSEIKEFKIIKESLDARRKNDIRYTYCVEV
ncbi:MAG: hypothetical protein ACRC68_16750, partial [Clostridium sp.]